MRVATPSRNARSWVTTITLPLKPRSSSSSQAIESRSRWLVGSSSSSTSGTATSACASATRFFVPPDRSPMRARAVEVELRQGRLDALLPVPGVERLDAGLQRVEVDAFGMLLVALAHVARLGDAFADRVEHARRRVEHRLLRHVADAQALGQLQQAVVELLEAGDDLQQRRLAGAVAADEAEPLAGLERERRAVEQRDVAVREMGVGDGEDGHAIGSDEKQRDAGSSSRRAARRRRTGRLSAARPRARRGTSRRRRSRSAR